MEFAGRFGPLRNERCLELSRGGAFESRVGLAPFPGSATAAQPLVVEAESTRVADRPVDDDTADVRAMVGAIQSIPPNGAKRGDAYTGDP